MTKAQIWVSAFLLLFIILFLLGRLTKDEKNNRTQINNPVPQTNMASENVTGLDLINKLGCISCHGSDLTGTNMGPGLKNISEYWSRDKLINYLRNPSSYMNSERFKEYKEKYPDIHMPSFGNIDVKDLGKIADELLKK